MIVLLIVAIVMAVAIPTYLSARNRAENRAAQDLLSKAAQAELVAQRGSSGAVSPGGDGAKHLEVGLGPGVQLFYESASLHVTGPFSGDSVRLDLGKEARDGVVGQRRNPGRSGPGGGAP